MKTLIAGFSTLVLGIAVAHGAETYVPPASPGSDDASQSLPPQDHGSDVQQEQSYERTTMPDGSVREDRRIETKSKAKKKIDEKTTY